MYIDSRYVCAYKKVTKTDGRFFQITIPWEAWEASERRSPFTRGLWI